MVAHAIHFKSGISETSAAGSEPWKLAAAPVLPIASGHDVVMAILFMSLSVSLILLSYQLLRVSFM